MKYGTIPKNYYQLVKHIEDSKNDRTKDLARVIHSSYHNISVLGRRYNVNQLCNPPNPHAYHTIWRPITPRFLSRLYTFGDQLVVNRNLCNYQHYMNNILHYNKGHLIRDYVARVGGVTVQNFCHAKTREVGPDNVCFSDTQDASYVTRIAGVDIPEASRNPNDQCASQPKDPRILENDVIPYSRRAVEYGRKVTQMGGMSVKNTSQNLIVNTEQITKSSSNTTTKMNKVFCELFVEYYSTKDKNPIKKNLKLIHSVLKGVCEKRENIHTLLATFDSLYPEQEESPGPDEDMSWMVTSVTLSPTQILRQKLHELIDQTLAYQKWNNPQAPETYAEHYFEITSDPVPDSFTDLMGKFLIKNYINAFKEAHKNVKKNTFATTRANAKTKRKLFTTNTKSRLTRNLQRNNNRIINPNIAVM